MGIYNLERLFSPVAMAVAGENTQMPGRGRKTGSGSNGFELTRDFSGGDGRENPGRAGKEAS